jgi:hypothetical protein
VAGGYSRDAAALWPDGPAMGGGGSKRGAADTLLSAGFTKPKKFKT